MGSSVQVDGMATDMEPLTCISKHPDESNTFSTVGERCLISHFSQASENKIRENFQDEKESIEENNIQKKVIQREGGFF